MLGARRVGVHRSLFATKRARIAYEPYGVVGVIGAGSAPFAQPLGQIAGALLAGNGVVFKPALRARLAGERIARVLARAGLPEGLVRVIHGGADVGLELARAPVDKLLFTGSPATGRAVAQRVRVPREGGDGRAGRQGRDARARRRPRRASGRGALWAGCAGGGTGAGRGRAHLRGPGGRRAAREQARGGRARITVGDPATRACRSARLPRRGAWSTCDELVEEAVAQGATLHCGGPVGRAAGGGLHACRRRASAVLCAGGAHRSDARDARHARADGRPGAGGDGVRARSRRRSRWPTTAPYGLGASVWTADRYRGVRIARELDAGMVWLNDHLPSPAISRGPWGAAAGSGLGAPSAKPD